MIICTLAWLSKIVLMKKSWIFLLPVISALSWAGREPDKNALPPDEKTRTLAILNESLRDKDITRQQYDQSLHWLHATPCKTVDRTLNLKQKAKLEAAIARQQKLEKPAVIESYKAGSWSIIYSDAGAGDSPYFFYSRDPLKGAEPVTVWSGGAAIYETSEMVDWVTQSVPGIPENLADCFAWSVTIGH